MPTETLTDAREGLAPGSEPPPRAVLVLVHGPDPERAGERLVLPRGETVLGRSAPLFGGRPLDDPSMSTRHAAVRRKRDQRVEVRDVGSKNGVLVDGARLDSVVLRHGDLVQLGRSFLQLRIEPPFDWAAPDSALAGISHAVHTVRRAAGRAGRHTLPVLILGPTGTGKEPTAREVHRQSGRRGRFVAINCATLPAELVESELFGHIAGAFSGAKSARPGLFRAADGGTLFLDELATMPLAMQPKLLRALQEGRVRPVGGAGEVSVDVRVIAATNRDMIAEVTAGTFRDDLYARLCGAVIRTPPLAERPEDIPVLARRFLADAGHGDKRLDPALLWALLRQSWPLNVRALRQVVLATAAAADGVELGLDPDTRRQLEEHARLSGEPSPAGDASKPDAKRKAAPPPEELEATLTRHRGVVAEIARELGVHRYQVYRWVEAAGLDLGDYR